MELKEDVDSKALTPHTMIRNIGKFIQCFLCMLCMAFVVFVFNAHELAAANSIYLKTVVIPPYDSGNPEHFLITSTNNGWNQINNAAYRYFYIEAGNYANVNITRSGTELQPRYICLYNNDNTPHPAQLDASQQASVPIQFMGVENWVIDRISVLNYNYLADRVCFVVRPVSKNIVFNRCYFYNFCRGIEIQGNTDTSNYTRNITIQNCRMEKMSANGLAGDNIAILLDGSDITQYRKVENVHILNNEIVNCNDGVHTLRLSGPQFHDADYAGLIIDSNHIYVNSDVYTDGSGNHDPNGIYAWTENAVDLKAGSNNPDNPIIVSNNCFWGFRQTDSNGGGSGDMGYAMVCHYDVKNTVVRDNVIFDSTYGLGVRDNSGTTYSGENITICGNVIANISEHSANGEAVTLLQGVPNTLVEKNIIVSSGVPASWIEVWNNPTSPIAIILTKNVLVNMLAESGDIDLQTNTFGNYYYHTQAQNVSHGTSYPNISDAHLTDLTFTTDRFTNTPRTITLTGVVYPASVPNSVSALGISQTQINLSWADAIVARYEIYRDNVFDASTTNNAFSDTSLSANTVYSYKLRAYDLGNNPSAFCTAVIASTLPMPSYTPTATISATWTPATTSTMIFPNPATNQVTFAYPFFGSGRVILDVYQIDGMRIAHVEEQKNNLGGSATTVWQCQDVAPGIYLCRIKIMNSEGQNLLERIIKVAIVKNKLL